jgi:hypothetical protein
VLLLALAPCAQAQVLLRPTDRVGVLQETRDTRALKTQRVTVDTALLRGDANARMIIPLFDGQRLTVVRDRMVPSGKRGFVWHGRVLDHPRSAVTLSSIDDVLVGSIMTDTGVMYRIGYTGNGVHTVTQIDKTQLPDDDYPYQKRPAPTRGPGLGDTCSTDPPSDIDVLVLYTPDARQGAGGAEAMEATIYLAVEETNEAYIRSAVTQRLRLSHFAEVAYTESGNLDTDVTRLQNGTDGFMDAAHTLRNTYAADLVALLVENGGAYCGMAYDILNPVSNAFESEAFAVVARGCATGYYSFGHELGHLMAARHDWAVDSTNNSPYTYNHGYVNTAPTPPTAPWRTVMAYNTACAAAGVTCTRIQNFSNPNVDYPDPGGDPTGVGTGSQQSNNALTLNNTSLTVANFRCSSPGVAHVWAKDTWQDTGAEPDPATAGEPMWESPYIWVRNARDTGLIYQHEHQNPIHGQANWIYTKLHNGMASSASGNLEVYYADASTSLQWPSGWHLIASVPVSGFAAHSTRVVEASWPSLPGTGHFCLLARWISPSDPLTTPENADIDHNVRLNNKLVWRNVNIIELGPDQHAEARLLVRNWAALATPFTIAIRIPRGEPNFLEKGRVRLQLDRRILASWRNGGTKGAGFRVEREQIAVARADGATLDNIVLGARTSRPITLIFDRPADLPKRVFRIQVVQIEAGGKIVGGVTYEIHADRPRR